MNVKYSGPLTDYTGYGEASRHHVAALHAAGLNVIPQVVNYTSEFSDLGDLGKLVEQLNDAPKSSKYDIQMLHMTPDEYERFLEPGKYHIGLFYWETDRLPKEFAIGLQQMDEIWTGSEANKAAILSSNVDKPVYIFPQPIATDRPPATAYQIPDFDGFLFYSIFEWTDRKNPLALLRAYYEEFQGKENVGLLLKTYFSNFSLRNKRMIRNAVAALKSEMGLSSYPPVFLYLDLMDRAQVWRLHTTGDCFVSAHRGEGWGVPQVEAALTGNTLISTGYAGCHEYFTDGLNAHLLPYTMEPVKGMEHSNWYRSDQHWAEVDPAALRAAMRSVYTGDGVLGRQGQELVTQQFNLKRVGDLMAARLAEIGVS